LDRSHIPHGRFISFTFTGISRDRRAARDPAFRASLANLLHPSPVAKLVDWFFSKMLRSGIFCCGPDFNKPKWRFCVFFYLRISSSAA